VNTVKESTKGLECKGDFIQLKRIPDLNFYQYPPPLPAGKNKEAFIEKLELFRPLSSSEIFTFFISVPYCRTRCNSCPFFKDLLPKKVNPHSFLEPYVSSVETQLGAYARTERFSLARSAAVYIGGGTASLLSAEQASRIVKLVKGSFRTTEDIEVTMEGNPSDFSEKYYKRIIDGGVNRLSIGYQSSQERILRDKLGTPHGAKEGSIALSEALGAGFRTVNVDLLYGVPGQRLDDWKRDLETVISFRPEHITARSYVIYGNTLSALRINDGTLEEPIGEDEKYKWYLHTRDALGKNSYVEYRKGNFSLPGHCQKYSELTYRLSKESIGIGAGAYSFINGYLFRATNNSKEFMANIAKGLFTSPDSYSVKADREIMMGRCIMQDLVIGRISRQEFKRRFGEDPVCAYPEVFEEMRLKGLAEFDPEEIRLTELGNRWRENIMYAFTSEKVRKDIISSVARV
jgi:oxygen-independent coproporphyrinogen-3 oxidase